MRARYALGKTISGILFAGLAATGCTTAAKAPPPTARPSSTAKPASAKVTYNYTARDRDCLKRAMYFESEHSDRDGYMAVGTVVMNRLTSPAYPDTICEVVAQEKQFAPGVMTRVVDPKAGPELDSAVDGILRGERHPGVQNAMFFHTDGLKFPYRNMHYVVEAGGNVFYEKRGRDGALQTPAPLPAYEVAMNYVSDPRLSGPVQFAGVQPFATSTQIDVLLPEKGPIPRAMPDVASIPDATTTSAIPAAPPASTTPGTVMPPEGSPIALPTPRPAYNSAGLAAGHLPAGG
ncbi:cell wall hydrolase [Rhizobium mongolense]|uniref:Cell wall hydrolase n=2 Tax=Rhizobium mongolense TaxID=57676 RepID=A0A559SR20_9HYPH|nr:cell wall hydrolase [Rhizobium mongolense]TVZ64800.1 cell wall hydrolase [Rhizobium mongolense USDA 1844]